MKHWVLWFKLFLFRLLLALCTFSASHPDELWQFHEPAHVTVFQRGYLTWDWKARIRSYIFPLPLILAFWIAKGAGLAGFPGVEDFLVQFAPQVIKAFWASLTDFYTLKLSQKYFGAPANKWALLLILSNPAQASIGNRALSNSFETALCAVAAYLWPINKREWSGKRFGMALGVIGMACLVRISAIQMFLLAALFSFLYVPKSIEIFFIAIPMIISIISLGVAVDSFFYKTFTVSWWNFFQWNVVKNVSSFFGVEPFYFYFKTIRTELIRTSLPFTLFGLYKSFKSFNWRQMFPFIFFISPYFIFSSIQPHKEHRFILPILPFLIVYASHGAQQIEIWAHKKGKLLNFTLKILLMGFVAFNSIEILKLISLQAVGPWNTIQDLRHRILKTTHHDNNQSEGIFLLANCHNFPNYGVFHLNYPLNFITCQPHFALEFFKSNSDYNFQLDLSLYFHSGMIKETIKTFLNYNTDQSKKPPTYIVAMGYTFIDNREILKEFGYEECGHHLNYILDPLQRRDSNLNDIFITCRIQE